MGRKRTVCEANERVEENSCSLDKKLKKQKTKKSSDTSCSALDGVNILEEPFCTAVRAKDLCKPKNNENKNKDKISIGVDHLITTVDKKNNEGTHNNTDSHVHINSITLKKKKKKRVEQHSDENSDEVIVSQEDLKFVVDNNEIKCRVTAEHSAETTVSHSSIITTDNCLMKKKKKKCQIGLVDQETEVVDVKQTELVESNVSCKKKKKNIKEVKDESNFIDIAQKYSKKTKDKDDNDYGTKEDLQLSVKEGSDKIKKLKDLNQPKAFPLAHGNVSVVIGTDCSKKKNKKKSSFTAVVDEGAIITDVSSSKSSKKKKSKDKFMKADAELDAAALNPSSDEIHKDVVLNSKELCTVMKDDSIRTKKKKSSKTTSMEHDTLRSAAYNLNAMSVDNDAQSDVVKKKKKSSKLHVKIDMQQTMTDNVQDVPLDNDVKIDVHKKKKKPRIASDSHQITDPAVLSHADEQQSADCGKKSSKRHRMSVMDDKVAGKSVPEINSYIISTLDDVNREEAAQNVNESDNKQTSNAALNGCSKDSLQSVARLSNITCPNVGQWQNASFETGDRQNKFFRLLGGFKTSASNKPVIGSDAKRLGGKCSNMALSKNDESVLNEALMKEFDRARDLTFNRERAGGLGYAPPPEAGKKFYIDTGAKKSKKFTDD